VVRNESELVEDEDMRVADGGYEELFRGVEKGIEGFLARCFFEVAFGLGL
jgi:hypothetical protein